MTEDTDERTIRYYRNHEWITVTEPFTARAIEKKEYIQLQKNYWDLHPYRLIWQILWETGMRREEACRLRLENLDLNKKTLTYRVSKPKHKIIKKKRIKIYKQRLVPISEDLTSKLKAFISLNWGGFRFGYLFPSPNLQSRNEHICPASLNHELERLRPIMKGRWLKISGNGRDHLLGIHGFRRSWITRHLQMSKNPAQTCRAIGHEDINTTFKYYHEVDLEGLRTWINRESISIHIPKFALDQTRLTEFAEAL